MIKIINVVGHSIIALIALAMIEGMYRMEVYHATSMVRIAEQQWERAVAIPHDQKELIAKLVKLGGKVK